MKFFAFLLLLVLLAAGLATYMVYAPIGPADGTPDAKADTGGSRILIPVVVGDDRQRIAAVLAVLIAIPGGVRAVTWTQLGVHAKPCALLNVPPA